MVLEGLGLFMLEWCQRILPVLSGVIGHILISQGALLWCIAVYCPQMEKLGRDQVVGTKFLHRRAENNMCVH